MSNDIVLLLWLLIVCCLGVVVILDGNVKSIVSINEVIIVERRVFILLG